MPKPSSKASIDPNYEKQVRKLKTHAREQEYEKRKAADQVKYYRTEGWSGDPFDYDALGDPFKRDKANGDFEKAVSDAANPGTTGDVIATTTMVDQLAGMERAFRVRQTLRRPRATAHHVGRQRGHGDDQGPLVQLNLEYLRAILAQAAKAQ